MACPSWLVEKFMSHHKPCAWWVGSTWMATSVLLALALQMPSVTVSVPEWMESPTSPSKKTTLPPPRQGAVEPTPAGACSVSGQLFATTVFGAEASASVIWKTPLQPGELELQGVKNRSRPTVGSENDCGDSVPAPVSEVPSTTGSVEGEPSAIVPMATTGTLLNPSAMMSCAGRRISQRDGPTPSARHLSEAGCGAAPQTTSGTQTPFSRCAPAPQTESETQIPPSTCA